MKSWQLPDQTRSLWLESPILYHRPRTTGQPPALTILCFLSLLVSPPVGYVVGLGDRHVQNILIDTNTAEFIHIDLGGCGLSLSYHLHVQILESVEYIYQASPTFLSLHSHIARAWKQH